MPPGSATLSSRAANLGVLGFKRALNLDRALEPLGFEDQPCLHFLKKPDAATDRLCSSIFTL
jgi:hypothetical protein